MIKLVKCKMEINNVLEQFIGLCNKGDALLQSYLASNSALEWFGRTIRGRANIYPYYRFDLCQQYEHCFEKAEKCLPIEYKPSHFQTKNVSSADVINATTATANKTQSTSDDHSTPLQRIITPTLPKVGKEKIFITTPNISSVVSNNPYDITPPSNTGSQSSEADDPPTKRFRFSDESSCAGDAADSSRLHLQNEIPKSHCDADLPEVEEIKQDNCILPTQDEVDSIGSNTGYTDLMYLESIGTLRIRNKTKHRGITSVQHSGGIAGGNLSPTSSSNIDLTNASYERKTKLKVSYRIRLYDNQLQIALIIYEHLSRYPTTRRNLLHEFLMTNDNTNSIKDTKTIVSPAGKPKKSLKRALRLF